MFDVRSLSVRFPPGTSSFCQTETFSTGQPSPDISPLILHWCSIHPGPLSFFLSVSHTDPCCEASKASKKFLPKSESKGQKVNHFGRKMRLRRLFRMKRTCSCVLLIMTRSAAFCRQYFRLASQLLLWFWGEK